MKKFLLVLLFSIYSFGSDFNIELTNYTLVANSTINIPNTNFGVRGSYLYNDEDGKNDYYSFGFQAQGANSLDNYNSKLAIFIDYDHTKDNSALPIGIGIFNKKFGSDEYPLSMKASIGYAPAVLSFDKANKFWKGDIRVGIQPIQNARVLVGYRTINFNKNYQSVVYFGVGFIF